MTSPEAPRPAVSEGERPRRLPWLPRLGWDTQQRSDTWVRIYIDRRDWWIGVYRGPNHWYFCPLPCVVIRVLNKKTRATWELGRLENWPYTHLSEET